MSDTHVTLRITDNSGEVVHLMVRKEAPLRKAFQAFANKTNKNVAIYQFVMEGGIRLNDNDTPSSAGLQDDDEIVAHFKSPPVETAYSLPMASRFKGSSSARYVKNTNNNVSAYNPATVALQQLEVAAKVDSIDSIMGFDKFDTPTTKTGWLCNMHATMVRSKEDSSVVGYAGVDFYFLDEEGGYFKSTVTYDPYFMIAVKDERYTHEVEEMLKKYLETCLKKIETVEKDDLALDNHLVGLKKHLLKLHFNNSSDLFEARKLLRPILTDNESNNENRALYGTTTFDAKQLIEDIREYDVPYHVRVSIDKNIRVGKWYNVTGGEHIVLEENTEKVAFADPVVLAFDIETTKAPLKFPDAAIDQVMMISYMIDGDGFLITNREIISEDIEDFEYTPKPEYQGNFTIFNEDDEKAVLERFFEHIRDAKPTVIATFNGDFFDWPFVENRAQVHGLDMFEEIGFAKDNEGEYKSSYCTHMDCYRWVKRDSYLPQGSQGLKAVTTAKLGYNPIELDPELMTPYAYEKPQLLSEYSVSDAVATYYLYMKYVHPFIFSLCTIIPLNPDEVLRKGTGTLCEMLLMVQAYEHGILLPNKHTDPIERFYDGHLLESETYVGGHVESLEAGVFRSDIPNHFKIDPGAIDELLEELHSALKFCIEVECKAKVEDVENYDQIYNEIKSKLLELKVNNKRHELPLIYHVDVASMYPNIMTTNRLQPDSMKTEKDCAVCDFNRPGKTCDRRLTWAWRGEYYPPKMDEYNMIKSALQNESFPSKSKFKGRTDFGDLSYSDQVTHLKKRLGDYSRKVYHRVKQTETVKREAIVCQRENPFYVDTVKSFRDRRYEFKGLAKTWKKNLEKCTDTHAKDEAKKMIVLYDSLQLAHKVILNSFYGYVMRKGSRWYSMEMAGITCLTGATIIQMARSLVERVGRPLELDTDGIWCILPSSFPENFEFVAKGKKLFMSYPCSMLNYRVHEKFTNHQYQELIDPVKHKYKTFPDNSIFFEVDGPYKAMILPTSKEEGKGLKKRYAVFEHDGTLAELKGFELKRRGELQLIKNFQSDIFKVFLEGDTLETCYGAVAAVANRWLDVLDTRGAMLEDEDLIELICENRSMSKTLKEYEGQKSTSITTAKRLGEFLGEEMVKDAGLQCKYIISSKPHGAPVTERAIPVAIFSSELSVKRSFLRRWLLDTSLDEFDPRTIIDWEYYRERLASVVQKIITIPAALQDVANPVPRVEHPPWLLKKIAQKEDKFVQSSLSRFFKKTEVAPSVGDIEDIGSAPSTGPKVARVRKRQHKQNGDNEEEELNLPSEMPDMETDYQGWLQYQKIKWKITARDRERREKLFGSHRAHSAVGDMVRKQAESYVNSTWQVLQYRKSKEPGVLDVHVFIKDHVQVLKFKIPKKLYINFKDERLSDGEIESCHLEKVNTLLPSGEKSDYMFRLTMPEAVYLDEKLKSGSVLNHPNVAGLYETEIDTLDRVLIELGSCIEFSSSVIGSLGKSLETGFDLKNLNPVDNERYLSHVPLFLTYLFHLSGSSYEFFSLFSEDSWQIFVLKPAKAVELNPATIEKEYRELFQSKSKHLDKHYDLIKYPAESECEIQYFSDIGKLYKKLSNRLKQDDSKSLLVMQSPFNQKLSKILKISRPAVELSMGEVTLPSLNWQSIVYKNIVTRVLTLGDVMSKRIQLARYANIPLCNVQEKHVIDIEYARRLVKSDIALWWNQAPSKKFDWSFPIFNEPEIYDQVVLEFRISNLGINTVLTSALINNAEGADTEFAEDAFSGASLNVLRQMLKKWWDDALSGNHFGDMMCNWFIPWCQNLDSFLYDDTLKYHVHNLTKKAMLQMINEFKKLGGQVVYADRNKVLIKTTKMTVENSYAYGQYLVRAIKQQPLFNYLDLQICRYWDLLVWMDAFNYGGNACLEITEEDPQLHSVAKWQISEFLPTQLQPEFVDWWTLIIDALVKTKHDSIESASTQRATQLVAPLTSDEDERDLLSNFTQNLLAPMVKRIGILKQHQQKHLHEYIFPSLPGSHLHLTNPVLELVKYLCQVMSLSQKRQLEVRLLRKELLAVLEVREFHPDAIFTNPSTSLLLHNFICEHCHRVKDLDFCKEESLFRCEYCAKEHNRVLMEEHLIQELCENIDNYLLQEMRCNKCNKYKDDHMSDYCSCSGQWILTENIDVLGVFGNIAKFYEFKLLQGMMEDL